MEKTEQQVIEAAVDAAMSRLIPAMLQRLDEIASRPRQEWLSIKDVERVTGVSEDVIRRHVKQGLLPAANMGTFDKPLYRIRRQDVDGWMTKRQEGPLPAQRSKRKLSRDPYRSRHHQPSAA